jgi:hypothetical protein
LNPTHLPQGQLSPKLRPHAVEQCIANANRTTWRFCAWTDCQNERAYLADRRYGGDTPLCAEHIEHTWRIAQAVADDRNDRPEPEPREAKPRPVSNVGWIYYLTVGDHIKIGYASELARRLRSYPPTAKLIFAHRGTRDDEKNIHSRLHPYCAAGREWYDPHPRVLALIEAAKAEHPGQTGWRPSKKIETKPGPRLRGRTTNSQHTHRI